MRKTRWLMVFIALFLMGLPMTALARETDAVVSTDWLQKNLTNPKVIVVDIRKVEDYKAGHIPGAVNVFYGAWAVKRGDLLNELPPWDDLMDLIGNAGIEKSSWVVVVGKMEKVVDQFDMTRVAWTLKSAGVENVSILNGGEDKWQKEGKTISQDAVKPKAKSYSSSMSRNLFVDKAYVANSVGKLTLIDARAPAFYSGKEKLPFVAKAGRIKGSLNLPASMIFTPEGLFRGKSELAPVAEKVTGSDLNKEIIVICDSGRVATSWAFVMADVLGYKNVKVYDGSMQEWSLDSLMPIETSTQP